MMGFWTVTQDSKGNRVAIGIKFRSDTSSFLKMLPRFITDLNVPLVAIADA